MQLIAGNGRYVFRSLLSRDRPMSEHTVNGALRRLGYSKEEMTGHGFRSMASTLLNEKGVGIPIGSICSLRTPCAPRFATPTIVLNRIEERCRMMQSRGFRARRTKKIGHDHPDDKYKCRAAHNVRPEI